MARTLCATMSLSAISLAPEFLKKMSMFTVELTYYFTYVLGHLSWNQSIAHQVFVMLPGHGTLSWNPAHMEPFYCSHLNPQSTNISDPFSQYSLGSFIFNHDQVSSAISHHRLIHENIHQFH